MTAVRVLVGGVGYDNLRDGSVGPRVVERLRTAGLRGVDLADLSYDALSFALELREREPYDRMVFVGATWRDRPPGSVSHRRPPLPRRADDEVQRYVAELVTGVISLDAVLAVAAGLGCVPDDVHVVEVEPADHGIGSELSPELARRFDELLALVCRIAAAPSERPLPR